jgi:hypothetical protein
MNLTEFYLTMNQKYREDMLIKDHEQNKNDLEHRRKYNTFKFELCNTVKSRKLYVNAFF